MTYCYYFFFDKDFSDPQCVSWDFNAIKIGEIVANNYWNNNDIILFIH